MILFCSLGRTSGSVTVIKRGSRGIVSQNVVEGFRNKRISQISLQQVLLFSLFFFRRRRREKRREEKEKKLEWLVME